MSEQPAPPDGHEGYLLELHAPTWQTRYAVLGSGVLYVYSHRGEAYPRDLVLLAGCVVEAWPQHRPHSFSITHPSTTYAICLAASDTTSVAAWVTKLRAHAALAPRRASTGTKELQARPADVPKLWTESSIFVAQKYEYQIKAMMTDLAQHLFDASRWTLAPSDATLRVWTSSNAVMSKATIHETPPVILQALLTPSSMLQVDTQISALHLLSAVDPHTSVQYALHKPLFPASRKACVKLLHWRLLPDNSLVVVSRSLQNYALPASLEDVPRMALHLEGFHIVPAPDNLSAEVTYVLQPEAPSVPLEVFGAKVCQLRSVVQSPYGPVAVAPLPHPAAHAAEVEAALTALLTALDAEAKQWTVHGERDGVAVSYKPDGDLVAVRARGLLPFPAKDILSFVLAVYEKPAHDPLCVVAERVATLDAHTTIDYVAYKPVLLVSGRDFVTRVHSRELNDGSSVVVATSTTHPLCPLREPDTIRGHVHLAGWRITPRSASLSEVWFFVKTDLRGSIPARISQRVLIDQGFGMLDVAKALAAKSKVASAPASLPTPPSPLSLDTPPARPPPTPQDMTLLGLAQFMALFLSLLYAAPALFTTYLVEILHETLVWGLIAWMCVQLYLGPATNHAHHAGYGHIYAGVDIDVTAALTFLQEPSQQGICIRDVVVAAVARVLGSMPHLNSHIVLGKLYPSSTVDVTLVARGQHDEMLEPLPLQDLATGTVRGVAESVRAGIVKQQRDGTVACRQAWARWLPSSILQLALRLVAWLSQGLGLDCSRVGVPRRVFGQALVVELDDAYVPIAPWMHVPLLVVLGPPAKKPVVVDDQVVVRTMVCLHVTLDERYIEAADANRVTALLRTYVTDPAAHLTSKASTAQNAKAVETTDVPASDARL
ncbi:hypothetical protein SDRG_10076 [Saprolegnia diclina VS20]|uniref:START domain-containing protein n=1 Tax=Saprolegnia diclina (strain VS20) TaxID=1156394 RepID=T0Q3A6_SAPDV|nr:hypothetical protein SDRG_10076 [Saprolegnia diclina VS20]EQC32329.1 hypothetical protein SDRG_10076 [Saprolegnia diclina VS20]|eukprot:XP_008614270.1 hypothetical protein SDRG_10076 [Saprolegnia diclina VS20]